MIAKLERLSLELCPWLNEKWVQEEIAAYLEVPGPSICFGRPSACLQDADQGRLSTITRAPTPPFARPQTPPAPPPTAG
jgi:hypothetical protein